MRGFYGLRVLLLLTYLPCLGQQAGSDSGQSAAPDTTWAKQAHKFAKPSRIDGATTPTEEDKLAACSAAPSSDPKADSAHDAVAGITPPQLIQYVDAVFSKEVRKKKIQGASVISLVVSAEGLPEQMCLAESLGHGLDEQAALAVRQYRFKPAMDHGKAVPVKITVEVKFRLYKFRF